MIEIKQLDMRYNLDNQFIPILSINHLFVEAGERVAVTGPSGSGKSTLLHCIGGVLQPTGGELIVNGTNIASMSGAQKDKFRHANIGYIFQDFHLIPSLTAEENIKLVLPAMNKQEQEKLLSQWFERVGLSNRRRHLPSELSRGQQQRVAIIRALIRKPAIVLADEPTGSLDYDTARQAMDMLLTLCKEQKQTLLCVTHDLSHPQLFTTHIQLENINQVLQKGARLA